MRETTDMVGQRMQQEIKTFTRTSSVQTGENTSGPQDGAGAMVNMDQKKDSDKRDDTMGMENLEISPIKGNTVAASQV